MLRIAQLENDKTSRDSDASPVHLIVFWALPGKKNLGSTGLENLKNGEVKTLSVWIS